MANRTIKSRTVEPITVDEWQSFIEATKQQRQLQPGDKTIKKFAEEANLTVPAATRWLEVAARNGQIEKAKRLINGKLVNVYRIIKK
jgi:hypothetical protein